MPSVDSFTTSTSTGPQVSEDGILTHVVSDKDPASAAVTLMSATEHDLPAVVDLTTAFYEEDGFETEPQAVLRERLSTFLSDIDASLTVAATSDAVIGFALTTMRLILESGLVAELQDLYVRPEYRGVGVGSALVADAARWARDNAATILEVVIAPNGRDAADLDRYYASLGFRDEGRRLVHLDL